MLGRRATLLHLCWFTVACVLWAQPGGGQPVSARQDVVSAPATYQGSIKLDGPWKFETGDDPKWADPAFDDSNWTTVAINQPLVSQGIEGYAGYAWYRLRLDPKELKQFSDLTAHAPLSLFVESNSVGQLAVYVNGIEAGWTTGMTDRQVEYQSPPIEVPLAHVNPDGPVVVAIRSWAGPGTTIRRGLVATVELGSRDAIADRLSAARARQWDQRAISPLVVAFLFLCVAGLGAALYLAQREHSEYLWLALLCISVALGGAADALYGLGAMPLGVYRIFTAFTGRILMAVTLEFVLRFTASKWSKLVRIVQICVLALPILSFLHLDAINEALSVTAEVVFCVLVCVMLFQAWRRGRGEAGVMLLPFFLAGTADSADSILDYLASNRWLPPEFSSHRFYLGPLVFGTGTIAYTVFLGSLVAVILYRFIRVSQDEERANAEISAARSVQALLIPTQLPKNRNFVLESAYLPVNGVGGDFFQVLPLKDDSLLLVVGDVSGKGLHAAMNSSTLVGALRNELSHDPATVLEHLNRVLLGAVAAPGAVPGLDSAPCFATCLCARIYADATVTIANAGHLSPYREGRELELPPGLPLGVIADSRYEQTTFQLEHRDRLVFVSDGVVEATNAEGELFGFERTQQVSMESARYIAQTAKHFGQTDDITVVSLYVATKGTRRDSEELARAKD